MTSYNAKRINNNIYRPRYNFSKPSVILNDFIINGEKGFVFVGTDIVSLVLCRESKFNFENSVFI